MSIRPRLNWSKANEIDRAACTIACLKHQRSGRPLRCALAGSNKPFNRSPCGGGGRAPPLGTGGPKKGGVGSVGGTSGRAGKGAPNPLFEGGQPKGSPREDDVSDAGGKA